MGDSTQRGPHPHDEEPRLEDHTHEGEDLEAVVFDLDADEDASVTFIPSADVLGIDLPADPDEARDALLEEVWRSRRMAGEHLESLQRIAAEYENFRRRSERDQAEYAVRGTRRLIEVLLPTLDAFDAAMVYDPQSPGEEKLLSGMKGTYNQLMETLERHGLEVIDADGAPFDPAVHEAVAGGGDGDLVVDQVLRTGYRLAGKVVRPAMVMVAAGEAVNHASEDDAGDED